MRGRRWSSVSVFVLGLALTACGSGSGSGGTSATPDVVGQTYVTVGTDAVTPHHLVPGSQVWLTFTTGGISTSVGCNSMSGSAKVENGTLILDGPLSSTEMACSPALMKQDTWWANLLTDEPQIDVSAQSVVIRDNATTVTLTNEQDVVPDRPLTGTPWQIDSFVDGQTVSSMPSGEQVTVRFGHDALTFRVCNDYRAAYQANGSTLTIAQPSIVGTPLPCPSTAGPLADQVIQVLSGTATYEVAGDQLTVTNGSHGLVLTAADQG